MTPPEDQSAVERCSDCNLPKSNAGLYSLTQWISVCNCEFIDAEDSQVETIVFCEKCNKRVVKAREGSFTQWIFRSDLCGCEKPVVAVKYSQKQLHESKPDLSEDENERYIELADAQFPTDRFKPIGVLGEGTGGSVYLCRDTVLNKRVAVKCLKFQSDESLVAFQKEARINTRLEHPNIAKVIDFGIHKDESPYMVVEYLDGLNLEHHLSSHGAPDIKIALEILIQLTEAIGYAHNRNVFHRDIKPGNIIYLEEKTSGFRLSIIDFGLAQMKSTPGEKKDKDKVLGTPEYMAPDSVQGLEYDQRSEIYSIGCVACELLTGRLPFEAESSLNLLNKHATETAPLLSEIKTDVKYPKYLEEIVSKCLEKNPDERYQSAVELIEDLKQVKNQLDNIETAEEELRKTPQRTDYYKHIKTGLLILIPLAIVIPFAIYVASLINSEKQEKVFTPKASRELIDLKTELVRKADYEITSGTVKFTEKEGFMHPDNILAFQDEDMKALQGKNYDSVSFYGTAISGEGFKYLVDEPIKCLSLDYTPIYPKSFKYLNQMKGLEIISCENTENISDEIFDYMTDMKSVTRLTLNDNKQITDKSIPLMIKRLPDLVKLSLVGTSVTDKGAVKLRQLKHLKEVFFNRTIVTDKTVESVLKLPLTILLLEQTLITDKSLKLIARKKTIKQISVKGCKMITKGELKKLIKARPDIKFGSAGQYFDFKWNF